MEYFLIYQYPNGGSRKSFGGLKANYFVLNDPNDQTINDPKRNFSFFPFSENENENKQ